MATPFLMCHPGRKLSKNNTCTIPCVAMSYRSERDTVWDIMVKYYSWNIGVKLVRPRAMQASPW